MKCACDKSLAVLLNTHIPEDLYLSRNVFLPPLVSIAMSLGRHLRRGQLKDSFSRAFGEERVQEVRDMCYFPTGATLGMCQSHVSGNDSEKKDGRRGRSGRQRPYFTEEAWDQWIGRLCTPCSQTHLHTLTNTQCCSLMLKLTYLDPVRNLERDVQKNTWKGRRKHTQMKHFHLHTSLGIPQQSPPRSLSSWRMDLGNCQLKWNPHLWSRMRAHSMKHTHYSSGDQSKLLPRDRGWSTRWASYGQYIKQTTLSLTTPLKTSTWLIIIN